MHKQQTPLKLLLCCISFLGCNDATKQKSEASTQSAQLQPISAPTPQSTPSSQGARLAPNNTPLSSQPTPATTPTKARSSKASNAIDLATNWLFALRDKDSKALLEMASFPLAYGYSNPWRREPERTLCDDKTATDSNSFDEIVKCLEESTAPSFAEKLSAKNKLRLTSLSELSIYEIAENARDKLAASKSHILVAASFKGADFKESIVIAIQKSSSGFWVVGFFVNTVFIGEGPLPSITF